MFGLSSNRVAGRVNAITRKVAVRPCRAGKSSFLEMSNRLAEARRQVARRRAGR